MIAEAIEATGEIAIARPRSVLVGLIGTGIGASRTPALHEAEGAWQGLNYVYKLLDLTDPELGQTDLPDLLRKARLFGFAGLNITHPCKQVVLTHLDALSPDAEQLRAVNTVVFDGAKAVGHNTDWFGFAESFRRELAGAALAHVVLIGAGGAGAAVGHALLKLGAERLTIVDADESRAEGSGPQPPLAVRTRSRAAGTLRALADADGLVNATPVGMAGYPGSPVPADLIAPPLWVADIVYFPLETELLRIARRRGCRTMAGGGMAVFQAADAFRLFTGIEPQSERMLRHFRAM